MKNILVLLVPIVSILHSQTYNCIKHFDGIVKNDSIFWNASEKIDKPNLLTIKKHAVTIENGKYSFKIIELINTEVTDHTEYTYYATDWEDLHCYIIMEIYDNKRYIYFQYVNMIYGYDLEKR